MDGMEPFATVQDMVDLYRPLTEAEMGRAKALLPVVSDTLRQYARNKGRDLDRMIESGELLPSVARSVAVDVAARALEQSSGGGGSMLLSQTSQSALGYSVSGTYLNPGGGIFVKDAELKRLGLLRQRMGVIDFAGHGGRSQCGGGNASDNAQCWCGGSHGDGGDADG